MHHFLGVQLFLANIMKREKMTSWAVSGRNLRTALGRVSGLGAFSCIRSLAGHCVVCTGDDFVKGGLFLRGFGAIVCVCVRVLRVLP